MGSDIAGNALGAMCAARSAPKYMSDTGRYGADAADVPYAAPTQKIQPREEAATTTAPDVYRHAKKPRR